MNKTATIDTNLDTRGAPSIPLTLHNIARLRADTWNRLRDLARRLRRSGSEARDAAPLQSGIREAIAFLRQLEENFSFPGVRILSHLEHLLDDGEFEDLATICIRVARLRSSGAFRRLDLASVRANDYLDLITGEGVRLKEGAMEEPNDEADRLYFEVLLVDDLSAKDERDLRQQLRGFRKDSDRFIYELVVARSFEDAILAVLANPSIAAVVTRYSFPFAGNASVDLLDPLYHLLGESRAQLEARMPGVRTAELGRILKDLRPELDLYRVTDAPIESVIGRGESPFRRVFYHAEDLQDQHVSILKGVHDRFETPFFDALRRYSEKPTGMFHALPVSRGRTIAKSNWIRDFGDFYGSQLFFAETSATTGGLDSLLQPTGSLKRAQELAARAFGAEHTFFVTNGTSTANKIVTQALTKPGGAMLLQSIVIADALYETYRRSVDVIQRYIFPGGFLPSTADLRRRIPQRTDFRIAHLADISEHYPQTLRLWRQGLIDNWSDLRARGYAVTLLRMWEYYFCYSEGGFLERTVGDVQLLLSRPRA